MERRLIAEFENTVETVLERLDAVNLNEAIDVIAAWMDIRGFGPVKEESVDKTRKRVAGLLDNFAKQESKAA